jgi:hypothetical protein
MQKHKFKHFIRMLIVFTLFLSTAQNYANCFATDDGNTVIIIREGTAHGFPKTSSIQATIDGHYLTVVFLENLGSTLQGFLQSGKLTNPTDLDYIFNKAKTL